MRSPSTEPISQRARAIRHTVRTTARIGGLPPPLRASSSSPLSSRARSSSSGRRPRTRLTRSRTSEAATSGSTSGRKRTEIWLRFVLVPGLTDDPENVEKVAEYAATLSTVTRVEVLPFHQMGKDKWDSLGMPYELGDTQPPSNAEVDRVREQFRAKGLTVY